MRHVKFSEIDQYRTVCKNMRRYAETDAVLPKVAFKGTTKIHGTNGGVSKAFTPAGGAPIYFNSRSRNVTIESDNAGFAFFCTARAGDFEAMFDKLLQANKDYLWQTFPDGFIITIFGEFFGGTIQKNVAVSQLPDKRFAIFRVKVSNYKGTQNEHGTDIIPAVYIDHSELRAPHNLIYNIDDFETWTMEIDFNDPEASVNKLVAITEAVEAECPVGKALGVSGIGEGVVWSSRWRDGYTQFKVKGEKHSVSKVTKLAAVDEEKLANVQQFVDYAVTENRLEQGVQVVFGIDGEPVIQKMGDFIRWVVNDIAKEETDVLLKNSLEPKDVNKKISETARRWFQAKHC